MNFKKAVNNLNRINLPTDLYLNETKSTTLGTGNEKSSHKQKENHQ